MYIWAVLIVRRRRPRRPFRDYSRAEKFAGVDGIFLIDIIPIYSGFISSEIEIAAAFSRRRRRDTTTLGEFHSSKILGSGTVIFCLLKISKDPLLIFRSL